MPLAARLATLAALAVLICWRMPEVVGEGRFWAEEGKYFFAHAWTMPPARALLTPFGGYLNIFASGGTLAARWLVPLADAPYVTMVISLLVQLIAPAILLSAEDAWLRSTPARLAACLLVVLVPASEEIWLQTLHCQFQMTLAATLIMALDVRPRQRLTLPVLFLAPLSGPGTFVVLPLLVLRAALAGREDRRARIVQLAALATGTALQIGLFFTVAPDRGLAVRPLLFLCILTAKHLLVPFLGLQRAAGIVTQLHARTAAGQFPAWAVALPMGVFGSLLAAGLTRASRAVLWLAGAGLGVAGLSYYGAVDGAEALVDMHVGERYAYVPDALFGLAVLVLARTGPRVVRVVATLAATWMLVIGAADYRRTWPLVDHGPAWHDQISRWEADHAHPIALWPDGWALTLHGSPRGALPPAPARQM